MMYYKVLDGIFSGFFSKEDVENYKIDNCFEIEESERDILIHESNNEGKIILVDSEDKLYSEFLPCPIGFLKPIFNYRTVEWEETATPEEIEENVWREEVKFYNEELEFASKANVELVCGIITEDIFEEVKTYMKSIDPYAGIKTIPEVKRPEIFKKYL